MTTPTTHQLQCPCCGACAELETCFHTLGGIAYVCGDCGREVEHNGRRWVERKHDHSYVILEKKETDE